MRRPRLLDTLRAFERSDLYLLTLWAPGGAGKSTLLSYWAQELTESGATVAWVDIDSLQRGVVVAVSDARWLFIDDVDRLATGAGTAALAAFVAGVPANVKVVMVGRFEPSGFSTVTETAGGRVVITSRDLAFTVEETLALALRFGLVLPVQDAETLAARTGGWAAGLALAMPYLLSQPDLGLAVERFGGDQHQVADYLLVRILDALDDADRDVLMRTAVDTAVSLNLAVALTGRCDVGLVLQRLGAQNALVEEDPLMDGFWFHPILVSYMRAEFRRRDNTAAARNHIAAAHWFEAAGSHDLALGQALLSQDQDAIAAQLEPSGGVLLMQGHNLLVAKALRALPAAQDTLATAVIRLSMDAPGFPDRIGAERQIERMSELFAAATSDSAKRWRPVVLALSTFLIQDPVPAERRLGELGEFVRRTPTGSFDAALILRAAIAWCLIVTDRHDDADQLLRDVQGAALRAGYTWVYLIATDTAAALAVRKGDWRTANAYEAKLNAVRLDAAPPYNRATARAIVLSAGYAYARCEPVSFTTLHRIDASDPTGSELGLSFEVRALLFSAAMDSSPAPRDALGKLLQLVRLDGRKHPRMVAIVAMRLHYWAQSLHGPAAAADVDRLLVGILGDGSLEVQTLRLRTGHRSDYLAEQALADIVEGGRAWNGSSVVNAHLALAARARDQGRAAEAAERVRLALDLSEQFGFAREFLVCRGAGAQLVFAYRGSFGELEDYSDSIMVYAENERIAVGQEQPSSAVPLTPKEQELLLELPQHQTVAEIAAKHHVSVNTIKTHLRSIYAKLSAAGRTEAVSVARKRGLL